MDFDLRALIEKIYDNDSSIDLQNLLGMRTKYRYIILDVQSTVELSKIYKRTCDEDELHIGYILADK